MKFIKKYETWNNNVIDKSLFQSGKAKYDPKIVHGTIKYKTGDTPPYYFAEIYRKGDHFVCKVYKKKKDGDDVRLRNKIKKELKLAHNYVREYLNQRLKKDKEKKSKDKEPIEKFIERPIKSRKSKKRKFIPPPPPIQPEINRAKIRRF